MELVSANTKNYLFITMSQFNEQNGLVRARVTMRRDQPFWEGGNSFIACESFRISAAPSQGGLYYKILPDNFFVGAVSRTTVPDEEKAGFETLVKSGNTLQATEFTPSVITANTILKIPVTACVSNVPALGTDIVPSDPATVMPMIGELWNDHGIQKGQQIRMVAATGGNPVLLTGVVQNSPLLNLTGQGGGPSWMFYPITGYFETTGEPLHADPIEDLLAGRQGQLEIRNVGFVGPDVDLTLEMYEFMGGPVYLEIGKGPDGSVNTVPAALRGPGLEFMGPADIEVSGIPGGIYNDNNDDPDNIYHTSLKYRIYWKDKGKLQVGSSVYVIIPAIGGTSSHVQWGNITHIPDDWITAVDTTRPKYGPVRGAFLGVSWWRMTAAYRTWLNNNANSWGVTPTGAATGQDAFENMIDPIHPWVMSRALHVPNEIKVNLEVKVDATNTNAMMAGFHASLPITEFQIRKGNDRVSTKIERRACELGEHKYIYTPNELYWTFNNPQGGISQSDDKPLAATPYLLQTHENGGFKVAWDGTYSEFYMSVAMHDALGLNDYFEYYHTHSTPEQSAWDMCVQKSIERAEAWDSTYASSVMHVSAADLYVLGSSPLVNINAKTIAIGTKVVSANGHTEWILVSKSIIKDTEETSVSVKVYPTTSVDDKR